MARRKVSVCVYLTPEQAEALDFLNKRTGIPKAALVRRGIDARLAAARAAGELPEVNERPVVARRVERGRCTLCGRRHRVVMEFTHGSHAPDPTGKTRICPDCARLR